MLLQLLQAGAVAADSLSAVAEAGETAVQAAPAAVQAAPAAPQQMSESLFSLFTMGGPLMWVLLALSVLAIYIIGRKWWLIHQASKINPNFMNDIRANIRRKTFSPQDMEAFKKLFRDYRAASERFFAEGLRAGLYRALPAADLVRTFEGLAHEYLFEWDRAPADSRPSAAKLEERLFAVLSKLLLA